MFSQAYTEIPINTEQIPSSILNIEEKKRSNPLTWKGQFSPQLVETLLRQYARPNSVVFDPFVGSGTVLLESGRLNLKAYGTDINPAAVLLAHTYEFINIPISERKRYLEVVEKKLTHSLSDASLIFAMQSDREVSDLIKANLAELLIRTDDRREYQLLETLIILLDYWKANLTHKLVFSKWSKLRSHIQEMPFSAQPIQTFQSDARQTPLSDQSVNFVLTSPPYINVFNYHQQYRASAEALNWDVLAVARSEIGSNRKHRSNRFLTAIQYCLDMAQTFKELSRVCKKDGRLIFVVGRESTIRGVPLYNGELVTEVAHKVVGFDLVLRQERSFTNRFGGKIFEDILHFSPNKAAIAEDYLSAARLVAKAILTAALDGAPSEVHEAIHEALNTLETVSPSSLFILSEVLNTAENNGDK